MVFIGLIGFTGLYPKPMLERIEPAVDNLITHVEKHSDYKAPAAASHGSSTETEHEGGE